MFQSLALFVLVCLRRTAGHQAGQLFTPGNVSLQWVNDFEPVLTLELPRWMANCTKTLTKRTNEDEHYTESTFTDTTYRWSRNLTMEGGFLQLSLKSNCNGEEAETTLCTVHYPEMVRNVKCYIYSSGKALCSWDPVVPTQDVRFFYRLVTDSAATLEATLDSLRECTSYERDGGVPVSCHLLAGFKHEVYAVFNGSANGTLFRNTFVRKLSNDVRPSALNLTVEKMGDKFVLSWTPPEIPNLFSEYVIHYNKCGTVKYKLIKKIEVMRTELDVDPHCRYEMAIESKHSDFSTPWSKMLMFDAETKPIEVLHATVPLLSAGLAVLAFVCCWKNKEHLLPKVPQPKDFLSDITESRIKETICPMFTAVEEFENCNVSLVVDLPANKPDPS